MVSKKTRSIRSIALAAILLALLVVQEELLVALPNIQLTVALIILYAYFMPYRILIPLITGYVILDSLYMGSLNFIYFPAMLLAWLFLGCLARLLRNKPVYVLVILGGLFGFVYGWFFIPARMIEQGISIFWPYLMADLPFEILMAANNVWTVILVYVPVKYAIKLYLGNDYLFDS